MSEVYQTRVNRTQQAPQVIRSLMQTRRPVAVCRAAYGFPSYLFFIKRESVSDIRQSGYAFQIIVSPGRRWSWRSAATAA